MADHRHKRETTARRKPRAALVAGPLALLATVSAVTLGVLAADPESRRRPASPRTPPSDISGGILRPRHRSPGRTRRRGPQAAAGAVRPEHGAAPRRCAPSRRPTPSSGPPTVLNLWSDAGEDAKKLGELEAGKRVLVTGRKTADRVEIVVDGESRWVTAGYLSDEKPLGRGRRPVDGAVPRPRRRERADLQRRLRLPLGVRTRSRRSRRTAAGTATASTPRAARSTS